MPRYPRSPGKFLKDAWDTLTDLPAYARPWTVYGWAGSVLGLLRLPMCGNVLDFLCAAVLSLLGWATICYAVRRGWKTTSGFFRAIASVAARFLVGIGPLLAAVTLLCPGITSVRSLFLMCALMAGLGAVMYELERFYRK